VGAGSTVGTIRIFFGVVCFVFGWEGDGGRGEAAITVEGGLNGHGEKTSVPEAFNAGGGWKVSLYAIRREEETCVAKEFSPLGRQ